MLVKTLVINNLKVNRIRAALTIAAIAFSIALVVSVTSGYRSIEAAAQEYLGKYMGTTDFQILRSSGDPNGAFKQDVLNQIQGDKRIKLAVGQYSSEALVLHEQTLRRLGPSVDLMGINPNEGGIENLALEAGNWFKDTKGKFAVIDQVLAARGKYKIGDTIILGSETPYRLMIVGIVHKPAIMAEMKQSMYIPLETMQEFSAHPNTINRILIELKVGVDRDLFHKEWLPKIRQTDPLLSMKSATDLRKQMDSHLNGIKNMSYFGSTVSMLTAAFIVFSALSMGVAERQRTLAMLRAIGADKRQIIQTVITEGLMLWLLAALIGAPLGIALVKIMATWKADFFIAGVRIDYIGVTYAIIGSGVAAVLASLLPAYQAARVDPLEAMTPLAKQNSTQLPWVAALIGLVLITLDTATAFAPLSREVKLYGHLFFGLPDMMLGFFLIAPLFVKLVEYAFAGIVAVLMGVRPNLLRQQLSSGVWRTAGSCSALMVGLAILIAMQVQGNSLLSSWVLPDKFPDIFLMNISGVPMKEIKNLGNIPGILPNSLIPIAMTSAEMPSEKIAIKGMDLIPEAAMFFGVEPEKTLTMIELDFRDENGKTYPRDQQKKANDLAIADLKKGRHVIIPDEYRQRLNKNRGDKIKIKTPVNGEVEYTIAGVVWSPGLEVMVSMFNMNRQFDQRTASSFFGSLDDAQRDFGVNDIKLFAANLDMGIDKAKLVSNMNRQIGAVDLSDDEFDDPNPHTPNPTNKPATNASDSTGPFGVGGLFKTVRKLANLKGMKAGDVRQIKAGIQKGMNRLLLLLSSISLCSMFVAAMGITNTIMAGIRSRRWQFGILRAIGVTRAQLLRLVLAEALLLGLIGVAMGMAAGFLMSFNANELTRSIVGFTVPILVPWGIISIGVGVVMLTSILASLWPAITVARTEPLTLLQAGRSAG